jgi:hypothetical protein
MVDISNDLRQLIDACGDRMRYLDVEIEKLRIECDVIGRKKNQFEILLKKHNGDGESEE